MENHRIRLRKTLSPLGNSVGVYRVPETWWREMESTLEELSRASKTAVAVLIIERFELFGLGKEKY